MKLKITDLIIIYSMIALSGCDGSSSSGFAIPVPTTPTTGGGGGESGGGETQEPNLEPDETMTTNDPSSVVDEEFDNDTTTRGDGNGDGSDRF